MIRHTARIRRLLMPLIAAGAVIVAAGCSAVSEDGYFPTAPERLAITPTTSSYTVATDQGAQCHVEVSANVRWGATLDNVYATLSTDGTTGTGQSLSGLRGSQTLTVTFQANTGDTPRTIRLMLVPEVAGVDSVAVDITQSASDFTTSPASIEVGTEGGAYPLTIRSLFGWECTYTRSWLTLSQISGEQTATITVNVKPNDTDDSRSDMVSVESNGRVITVPVTQRDGLFRVDGGKYEYTFTAAGGSERVRVVCPDNGWDIDTSETADWCHADSRDIDRFTISADPYEQKGDTRVTSVVLRYADRTLTLRVLQTPATGTVPGEGDHPLPDIN